MGSPPPRVTLNEATNSSFLEDLELLKPSSSANLLMGLVFRDTSSPVVSMSLLQSSKTSGSSSRLASSSSCSRCRKSPDLCGVSASRDGFKLSVLRPRFEVTAALPGDSETSQKAKQQGPK